MNTWDNIPQELRDALAIHQYTIRGHLPNVRDSPDWNIVGDECDFAGFQIIAIKNALFPVEGKSYQTFVIFVLYFL